MPTPIYINGFENRVMLVGGVANDTAAFFGSVTDTSLTPITDTTHRGAGARSIKFPVPGSGTTSQATRQVAIASSTKIATRFYFRKSGNPSQTNNYIWVVGPAASTFFQLVLKTDGTLQLLVTGGTGPTNGGTSSALSNDTWYCIDVVVDVSTTAYSARFYVDGTQISGDASTTGAAAGAMTYVRIGKCQSGSNTTAFDMYFDDLIIGTAVDLTDVFGATDGIVGLVPDGDGTHSPSPPTAGRFKDAGGTDISGSNAAWDNVDSGDLTQTAERISQPVAASTEYLEVTMQTTTLSASAPVAVQGEVGLNTDGTNAFTANTLVRNGSTDTNIFNGDWSIAAGTKVYKRALVTVADQTELDGLRMRLGFGASQPATPYWEGLMIEVDIGIASAQEVTVDPATETDAAQELKLPKVDVVAEADSSQAVDIDKQVSISASVETDTAQALSTLAAHSITAAVETDTAQAVLQARVVTPATETDAGQSLDADKQLLVSAATEIDEAPPTLELRNIPVAEESDSAQAITYFKALTPASETDVAQVADVDKFVVITAAEEIDAAAKAIELRIIQIAAETDTAQAASFFQGKVVPVATETDEARGLSYARSIVSSVEVDTSQPIDVDKALSAVLALETDSAQAITKVKSVAAAVPVEADSAQALDKDKTVVLPVSTTGETAVSLVFTKTIFTSIGPATETDTAFELSRPGKIDAALESDQAQPLVVTKPIHTTVAPAAESETGQVFIVTKRPALAFAFEIDSAVELSLPGFIGIPLATETDKALTLPGQRRKHPRVSDHGRIAVADAGTIRRKSQTEISHTSLGPTEMREE